MTGVELIAAERRRQIEAEGWTLAHDDEHDDGSIAEAAATYALPDSKREYTTGFADPLEWPWDSGAWKPCPDDRIRELVKAGALVAAEIDRLLRAAPTEEKA